MFVCIHLTGTTSFWKFFSFISLGEVCTELRAVLDRTCCPLYGKKCYGCYWTGDSKTVP
jgi:hypothetical protein